MPAEFLSISRLLFCAGLLVAAGCAPYPMGLSKEEWQALPSEQKFKYAEAQRQVDADNFQRAEAERQRSEEAQTRQELRLSQPNPPAKSYLEARYEDIVVVRVHDGMLAFNGRLAAYEPVSFTLIRGETKVIKFVEMGRRDSVTFVEMQFGEGGRYFLSTARRPSRSERKAAAGGKRSRII